MSESAKTKKRIGWRGWLTISLSSLLVAISLALFWLLFTEPGLRWVIAQAERHAPLELQIGEVEGNLAGPLRLSQLQIADDDWRVEIEDIGLDWRMGLLLSGGLHINALNIEGLDVYLPPGEAQEDEELTEIVLPEQISTPLRIHVGQLQLNRARLHFADEAEALELDHLAFSGRFSGSRLSLDDLLLRADWLDLTADLNVDMSERWPLHLEATWDLRWPELPAIAGQTRLAGDQRQVSLDQHIQGPAIAHIEGDIRRPLSDPRVALDLTFSDLTPRDFLEDAPEGQLAGQYRLSGRMEEAHLDGALDFTGTEWGDLHLQSDITSDSQLERLQIHGLSLSHGQHPLQVAVEGEIRDGLSEDPELDLSLEWESLNWPLEDPAYRSDYGQARLAGRQSDYQLELDGHFASNETPEPLNQALAGEILLSLTGDQDRARVENLSLRLEEGPGFEFSGDVAWAEADQSLQGAFRLQDFDPALVAPDWPGALNAEGEIELHWGEALQAKLKLADLSGELLGESVQASGSFDYTPERVQLDTVTAQMGESRLQAHGAVATDPLEQRSELDLSLTIPDLAQLPLDASGMLTLETQLRGSLDRFDLNLDLQAENLRYEEHSLDTLSLAVALVDSGESDSELELALSNLSLDGEEISRLLIRGDGQRGDHRLSLQMEHPIVDLGLSFAGGLNADWQEAWRWDGEWVDSRLNNAVAGQWQQREARPLRLSQAGGGVEQLCLDPLEGAGELCLSGDGNEAGHWGASVEGEGFPLAMLLDQEATGIDVQGSINLSARAEDRGEGINAQGQLDFTPGQISQSIDGQAMDLLAIEGGQATFNWRPESARADLDLALSDGGFLRGGARLPEGLDGPLAGRLDAEIPQLGLLPLLVPEIGRADGLLSLAVDIRGNLEDPDFSGEVQVIDAELNLPDLGITAKTVNVLLTGDMGQLSMNASAESGEGDLQFRADLNRDEGDWVGEAELTGERFLILAIPDARVRINPNLTLTVSPGQRLDVGGEIHVPLARLTPGDIRATVQSSPDEVIVGELQRLDRNGAEEMGDWEIFTRVRASLGSDVRFEGYGLTGRISGALNVRDQPGGLTRATGELEILDGQYTAWRQSLDIERGRLFYSDTPITDPALDIRAVRRPRDVVVGVNIRGTLREPRLDLFSEPAMQQSEQLSYLLTGRPLTEGGEGDMDLVREASLALQVAGGGFVGRQLGDRLGVDTVTIETGDADGETSVVFGEYLSPRLFISYGIGLFEGINVFRMRYEISSRWFLEAQTGGAHSGADFIYSLERG